MIILITSLFAFLLISLVLYYNIIKVEYIYFSSPKNNSKKAPLRVLLLSNSYETCGGGGIHIINLYKNLLKNNINTHILVVKNSEVERILKKLKLPYFSYKKLLIRKNTIQLGLTHGIYKICKKEKINLINCHLDKEVKYATQAIQSLKNKPRITLTHMAHLDIKQKYISKALNSQTLKGIIYASPQIAEKNSTKVFFNKTKNQFIPPIFNQEKFLNFKTNQNKKDFFKKEFGIEINNAPIICMIAHMYKDESHKNHRIVINAINKLINKNKPIQMVFAGTGAREEEYKNLVNKLKLEEYIHFLGHTNKIPEIIYHSDINLLASNNEAFGIVLLEAALLKKPLICATKTGAANLVVINNKTGLLFENNNLESLVNKIEHLLNNLKLCNTLGNNAYQHIYNNFLANKVTNKMINFYQDILHQDILHS